MAVTVDATSSSGRFSAQSSVSWSHTVASGASLLVVICPFWNGGGSMSSVTWNGTALTRQKQSGLSAQNDRCEIWYLISPASGTHTIAVTPSAATDGNFGGISLLGSDTTTPFRTSTSDTATGGSNTTATISPTGTTTGDLLIDGMADSNSLATITMVAHTGRTQIFNDGGTGGAEGAAASYNTSASNPQTCDWTLGSSQTWAMAAVVVAAAGGGGGSNALVAALAGAGHLSGALSTKKNLSTTLAGQGHLSGGLSITKNLSLTLAGHGHLNATLSGGISLSAALAGKGNQTAALSVIKNLAAGMAGKGTFSPVLAVKKNLGCTLSGHGSLTGTLASAFVNLSAALSGRGHITGALSYVPTPTCVDLFGTTLMKYGLAGYAATSVTLYGAPLCTVSLAGKVC